MPTTYIDWTPVYNHGCGWRDCPECGPAIELEIEAKHRRKVASSYPRSTPADQVSSWVGEAYGTTAPRGATSRKTVITKAERALARAQRDQGRERVTVIRSLAPADKELVTEVLKAKAVHRSYLRRNAKGKLTRTEWKSEVWLQLLNPTALVARRESRAGLKAKLAKAIDRAEYVMRAEGRRVDKELAAAGVLN